jgi:hypothetical protein
MANTSRDEELSVFVDREEPRGVTPVVDGQQWGREKWRFALTTVSMSRENCAMKASPHVVVANIGIMAKAD